jgi:hypothetical protein
MNGFEVFFYFLCFAVIAGSAFAMMWANIRSINMDMNRPIRHPEAPKAGEQLMYVDFSREQLERIYEKE